MEKGRKNIIMLPPLLTLFWFSFSRINDFPKLIIVCKCPFPFYSDLLDDSNETPRTVLLTPVNAYNVFLQEPLCLSEKLSLVIPLTPPLGKGGFLKVFYPLKNIP